MKNSKECGIQSRNNLKWENHIKTGQIIFLLTIISAVWVIDFFRSTKNTHDFLKTTKKTSQKSGSRKSENSKKTQNEIKI